MTACMAIDPNEQWRALRAPSPARYTGVEWVATLESLHLEVPSNPMSEGTPFANVQLIARAVETA